MLATVLASLALTGKAGAVNVDAFAQEVRNAARLFRLPGLSIGVVRDGKLVYRQNEGYADLERRLPILDDSVFSIASVTKTFTGVMMMQMEREGRLSFDDYLLSYPLIEGWHSPRRIDPNIRLKHVLSMTSGGIPGRTYCYHGGRFNFLAEVFDKMTGQSSPQSYVSSVTKRILEPLGMRDTRAGYPSGPNPLKARIVKRYAVSAGPTYKESAYDWDSGYPAAGLFSTVADMALYAAALDDDRLISPAEYRRMTTPFVNDRGQTQPYAFGWFSQRFEGHELHWAYGQGTTDSALFLRVPDLRLTLILFANDAFPSEAPRFAAGEVLRSPFAVAFVRRFVLSDASPVLDYGGDVAAIRARFMKPSAIDLEELTAQTMARAYVRERLGETGDRPEALAALLARVNPDRFSKPEWTLLETLTDLKAGTLKPQAARLLRACLSVSDPSPYVTFARAKYYEKQGEHARALAADHDLADRPGFEDESAKLEACRVLGRDYLLRGDTAKGRIYLWKAALLARDAERDDLYRQCLKDLQSGGH